MRAGCCEMAGKAGAMAAMAASNRAFTWLLLGEREAGHITGRTQNANDVAPKSICSPKSIVAREARANVARPCLQRFARRPLELAQVTLDHGRQACSTLGERRETVERPRTNESLGKGHVLEEDGLDAFGL